MCSIENIQSLNKHKTSVSVYCVAGKFAYNNLLLYRK